MKPNLYTRFLVYPNKKYIVFLLFFLSSSLFAQNQRTNEAILRTLRVVDQDTKIIKPKVCDMQIKTTEILERVIEQSEIDQVVTAIENSRMDTLESKVDLMLLLQYSVIDLLGNLVS